MLGRVVLSRDEVRGRVDPSHDPRHEALVVALHDAVQLCKF